VHKSYCTQVSSHFATEKLPCTLSSALAALIILTHHHYR